MVEGKDIQFKVDTGAQANVIPTSEFNQLPDTGKRIQLIKSAINLTSYTGDKLIVKGQCTLRCNGKLFRFFVVDTDQAPVISFRASRELDLIRVLMNISTDSGT